jgi:hypothetical protein
MTTPVTPQEPALTATGELGPIVTQAPAVNPFARRSEQTCLEEILPQLKELGRRVGGFQKLREIIANLDDG